MLSSIQLLHILLTFYVHAYIKLRNFSFSLKHDIPFFLSLHTYKQIYKSTFISFIMRCEHKHIHFAPFKQQLEVMTAYNGLL